MACSRAMPPLRRTTPAGPRPAAWRLLAGALAVVALVAGLAWWWAPVFAAVLYAGSLEFLMVGLAATAAPVAAVALTTFVVNARHVFYALSFPLHRVRRPAAKLYSTYTLSDEAYAVAVSSEARDWTGRQILLMQFVFHLIWTVSSAMGGLLGAALPIERVRGLDFALTALFIVLAIDAYRQRPDRVTALSAALCALAAWWVVPGQLLVCAFAAFTGLLLVRYARGGRSVADAG